MLRTAMCRRAGGAVVALLVAIAAGCGGSSAKLGGTNRIAFARFSDAQHSQIYVMNDDGSAQTELTSRSAPSGTPAWAPDGKRLAVSSGQFGKLDIYAVNADGSGRKRIAHGLNAAAPSWSPDGKRLAFMGGTGKTYIAVVDANGKGVKRLGAGSWPSWLGRDHIVFTRAQGNGAQIFEMTPAGKDVHALTHTPGNNFEPASSPDGRLIAFASDRDGNQEIYVMRANGSGARRLTRLPGNDHWPPSWSPDGKRIVFTSDGTKGGRSRIAVVGVGGGKVQYLTDGKSPDAFPSWQP